MNRRAAAFLVVTAFFGLAAPMAIAQDPPLPTEARLQALKLDVIAGDIPAYYSHGIARDVVASVARRLEACRSLYPEARRSAVALAVLNANDWQQLTPFPYGMPHSGAEPPYVVVVPNTWRDVSPMLAGARDRYAKIVGEANVDPSVRLLAVHEMGHIITSAILGQKNWASIASRFPFWYGEFVVNYFAGGCNALQSESAALARRWDAAGLAIGRQKYRTLDDWDRLMSDVDAAGRPYLTTEDGGLNFAAYQALSSEMANRVRDAGFAAPRMIQLLREQWVRSGRQSTDVLLQEVAAAAPGLHEWLVQQRAVEEPGRPSVPASGEVPLFSVKVTGQGQSMILIPGLMSSGAVWDGTVEHYSSAYQCHELTLAGFAGQPPSPATPFLASVRDAVAAYIRKKALNKPILVGHSLGGVLALSIAAQYPELVGKIISVDGPPAPGAMDMPKATPDQLKAMAEQVSASFAKADPAARRNFVETLVTSPEHVKLIASWGPSDPDTVRRALAELIPTDLRADLARIQAPILVLGTWASQPGADSTSVARAFKEQLSQAKSYHLEIAPTARHFLMYDDPDWMFRKMDEFLAQTGGAR